MRPPSPALNVRIQIWTSASSGGTKRCEVTNQNLSCHGPVTVPSLQLPVSCHPRSQFAAYSDQPQSFLLKL